MRAGVVILIWLAVLLCIQIERSSNKGFEPLCLVFLQLMELFFESLKKDSPKRGRKFRPPIPTEIVHKDESSQSRNRSGSASDNSLSSSPSSSPVVIPREQKSPPTSESSSPSGSPSSGLLLTAPNKRIDASPHLKKPRPKTLAGKSKRCCICGKYMVFCSSCNSTYCTPCFEVEHEHPNLSGHAMGINYSIASLCLICREGSGVWCHDCGLHYCGTCFDVEHSHPSYATHTSTPRFTHWEIDWNEVTILDKLGEGHFGSVLKAKWRGQEVAVKRLVTQNLSKETLLDFVQEAEAMQQLAYTTHKNVVELFGMCTESPNLCLMMEYCPAGSLDNMLKKIDVNKYFISFAKQIAEGMCFLHERGVIHRDLSARNLLVKEENSELILKIADFGMSRFHKATMHKTHTNLLPFKWAAPECGEHKYCKESDVWSYGITLIEILNRGDPYPNKGAAEVFLLVVRREIIPSMPANCPKSVADVVNDCFKYNPKERPSFETLCKKLDKL